MLVKSCLHITLKRHRLRIKSYLYINAIVIVVEILSNKGKSSFRTKKCTKGLNECQTSVFTSKFTRKCSKVQVQKNVEKVQVRLMSGTCLLIHVYMGGWVYNRCIAIFSFWIPEACFDQQVNWVNERNWGKVKLMSGTCSLCQIYFWPRPLEMHQTIRDALLAKGVKIAKWEKLRKSAWLVLACWVVSIRKQINFLIMTTRGA